MPTSDSAADLLATALPQVHTWTGRPGADQLAPLPNGPAVALLISAGGAPVQLLTAQQLRRAALARLTSPPEPRRGRADLAEIVRGVRWRPISCPFEARWWYYRLTRQLHPQDYRKLVSFGPAWFLHVDWARAIPEIAVTERIWCTPGEFLGPWPTHKPCQEALAGLWDLFDLCRYPEQVQKAPHGTRCAYADMGRCDAPCDGAAPVPVYAARCRDAWRFAGGATRDWIAAATGRMTAAAARQKYELAAQIKQQLEFARRWASELAPRLHPIERVAWLLGLPVTRRQAWKLFFFHGGHLAEGPVAPHRRVDADAAAWLAAALACPAEKLTDTVRMEQTWLVCHLLLRTAPESAIAVSWPELTVPRDLARCVRAQADAARARRGRGAREIAE